MTEGVTYSIPQVCQRTGLSRSFIYLEIERGRLAALKIGRNRRVRAEDIARWIKTHHPGETKALKARARCNTERKAKEVTDSPVFDNTALDRKGRAFFAPTEKNDLEINF